MVETPIEDIALRSERNHIKTKRFLSRGAARQRRIRHHPASSRLQGIGFLTEIECEQRLMCAWRAVLIKLTVFFHKMRLQSRRFFDDSIDGLPQQLNVERPVNLPIAPDIERQLFGNIFPQPEFTLGDSHFMQFDFLRRGLSTRTEFPTLHISLFVHNIL